MRIAASAPDEALRERALAPDCSFLVQAPAGAGKTELLIQRFLRLLSLVDEPEEILAITFTRKAAAEMQRRICQALAGELSAASAETTSGQRLRQLVAAVRARDLARGWGLAAYPSRLRISTIDSLNSSLARSTPVSSGANVLRPLATQFEPLYRQAAREAVRLLVEDDAAGAAVASLLGHFDNRLDRLESLLAGMLARRDQWLPIIGTRMDVGAARAELEAALARVVSHELDGIQAAVPAELLDELTEIVHAAAINRGEVLTGGPDTGHPVSVRLQWWQFAAATILTKTGSPRSRLTVTEGFPPAQQDLKQHAAALIARIDQVDGLLPVLATVTGLPSPVYPAAQWQALEALLQLLPVAAAGLKLVFAARGLTDYVEIAAEGRAALGEQDAPSELAMRVDWRIRHVLLDEFQDTSQPQYELLQALMRGWSPGDGRTLFLVGDPMQSIYGFRQAEVRLFLASRDRGIPGVQLEFIRLCANFRSVAPLVDWVNRIFPQVFPPHDDLLTSAIAFVPSQAAVLLAADAATADTESDQPEYGVALHASAWSQAESEGLAVAGLVAGCLQRWPDDSIGILARSRVHAAAIVSALRAAQIEFSAPDLVQLGKTAIASELLALTHALLHAGDRLAWLSVLRAPWCGLTLVDLEALAAPDADDNSPIVTRCSDERWLDRLSPDGRARVRRLATAFTRASTRLGQVPLRDVVEGLWIELGGPAVAGADLPLADLVLRTIGQHDSGGDCADLLALDAAIAASPSSLPGSGAQVQVMTIHKAKGLQFDTVILPALGRATRRDQQPALLWQEVPSAGGRPELLLAPVNAAGEKNADPLYALLWRLRRQQRLAETDRLLYVAATRAIKRLHLFGQLKPAEAEGEAAVPEAGSLLERLWPALGLCWPSATDPVSATADDPLLHWQQPVLRRLPGGWQRPLPPPGLNARPAEAPPLASLVPYDWASSWAMHAGAVAHRWLQHIATLGVEQFAGDEAALRALQPAIRRLLIRAGVESDNLNRAIERVLAVLSNALADERGRWLLSSRHAEAVNEYPLTVKLGEGFRHLVVDRSFICEQGMRWIVDYKTSSHEGGDRAQFIASESLRYAAQLMAYRQAYAQLETRPITVALYFPLLRLLQPVELPAAPPAAGSE